MPDYDLSRLSWRSFEQLIQALAVEILGPGTVIFGDGPDGGREAAYTGKVSFPSDAENWDGYIVVQAKFRQKEESTDSDNTWLVGQIRKDLDKFVVRRDTIRSPDFYLICSNVTLSSVAGSGGKDKISQLIDEYREVLGIQDYRVWDRDQIVTFLDLFTDIRQAYSHWVVAGDVLSKILEQLDGSEPDFETTLKNFLENELLNDLYVNLEQAGHTTDERIPLSNVFVDLPIDWGEEYYPIWHDYEDYPRDPQNYVVSRILDESRQKLDPLSLSAWKNEGPSNQLQIPTGESGRVVLIGGPGQGKSTVGQFIAQVLRAEILKDNPPHTLLADTKNAIAAIDSQCNREKLTLGLGRRFPIRVELKKYAQFVSDNPGNPTLINYICSSIQKRTGKSVNQQTLEKWLSSFPWALIFDGLDEVPATSNRNEVLEEIQSLLISIQTTNADVFVMATTRPQGYNQDFSPATYRHYHLKPLNAHEAEHYGRRFAEVRFSPDQERVETVISRLLVAVKDESTARLMRSPLQVTIMATLVDRGGPPPRERWRLFNRYYEVIYERETSKGTTVSNLLQKYETDINSIHRQLGLVLQTLAEDRGSTDTSLSPEQLSSIIETRLSTEGYSGTELTNLVHEFTDAAVNRLVFVVGLEEKAVGFEIRSLQEFMAAEALMDGEDADVGARLNSIANIPFWRNVFLFAVGKCFAERQHFREKVYTICATLNEASDAFDKLSLSGSRLALDILEDQTFGQSPKFLRLFASIALETLNLTPGHVHYSLASSYSEPLNESYRGALRKSLESHLLLPRLAAFTTLFRLGQRGVAWADELANEYWPKDTEDQDQILVAQPEPVFPDWIGPDLKDNILRADWPLSVPYRLWLDRQRRPEDEVMEQLSALFSLVNPGHGNMIDVAVLGQQGFVLQVNAVRSQRQVADLNDLELPDYASTDWQSQLVSYQFDIDPNEASLNTSLTKLAELWAITERKPVLSVTSWPIYACLSHANTPDELLELADLSKSGDLGTLKEWQLAEKRWKEEGLSEDDFRHEKTLPLSPSISSVGLPPTYRLMHYHYEFDSGQDSTLERLAKEQLPSKAQSVFDHICMSYLNTQSGYIQIDPWLSYLTNLFDRNDRQFVSPEVLFGFEIDEVDHAEWLELAAKSSDRLMHLPLSYISGRFRSRHWLGYMNLLEMEYLKQPKPSYLILLAELSRYEPSGLDKLDFHALNPEQFSESTAKKSAVLLLFHLGIVSREVVRAALSCVEGGADGEDEFLAEAALRLTTGRASRDDMLHYISIARPKLADKNWEPTQILDNAIVEFLSKQKSLLTTNEGWENLKLPECGQVVYGPKLI